MLLQQKINIWFTDSNNGFKIYFCWVWRHAVGLGWKHFFINFGIIQQFQTFMSDFLFFNFMINFFIIKLYTSFEVWLGCAIKCCGSVLTEFLIKRPCKSKCTFRFWNYCCRWKTGLVLLCVFWERERCRNIKFWLFSFLIRYWSTRTFWFFYLKRLKLKFFLYTTQFQFITHFW